MNRSKTHTTTKDVLTPPSKDFRSLSFIDLLVHSRARVAHVFVDQVIESPDCLIDYFKRFAASLILKVGFGHDVPDKNAKEDRFVGLAEETMKSGSLAAFAGFLPFVFVAIIGFLTVILRSSCSAIHPRILSNENILWSFPPILTRTVAAMKNFVLVMMLYPEVRKKAQMEVADFITREDRLPGPTMFTQRINIWAVLQDESVYPNPYLVDPNRFLGPNPRADSLPISFGADRRICSGGDEKTGEIIEPLLEFTTGIIVSHVKLYKGLTRSKSSQVKQALIANTG
ncbi:hypothetical protein C8J56DRAFT_1159447 [Mycena floridula]|nr:hypothetical protein C8J56DRAFT_1159447 [Mycena floridula]